MAFDRILVAVDHSSSARAAVDAATRLATGRHARLTLLAAVPSVWRSGVLSADTSLSDTAESTFAVDLLDRRATALRCAESVETMVRFGPPAEVILAQARTGRYDAVVLGCRGHGPLRSLLSGSVSRSVLAQSPIPVLVGRGEAMLVRATRPGPFRTVLVGIDGSPESDAAVDAGADIARAARAALTVVTVNVLRHADGQPAVASRRFVDIAEEGERLLDAAAARLPESMSVQLVAQWSVSPRAGLLEEIALGGHDLVVLGSRGRGQVSALLLGSTSAPVVEHSPVPVLVIRPEAADLVRTGPPPVAAPEATAAAAQIP